VCVCVCVCVCVYIYIYIYIVKSALGMTLHPFPTSEYNWNAPQQQYACDQSKPTTCKSVTVLHVNSTTCALVSQSSFSDPTGTVHGHLTPTMYRAKPTLKDRQHLYKLIISQLLYDGYTGVANTLVGEVKPPNVVSPSEQLMQLAKIGEDSSDAA